MKLSPPEMYGCIISRMWEKDESGQQGILVPFSNGNVLKEQTHACLCCNWAKWALVRFTEHPGPKAQERTDGMVFALKNGNIYLVWISYQNTYMPCWHTRSQESFPRYCPFNLWWHLYWAISSSYAENVSTPFLTNTPASTLEKKTRAV